MNSTNDDDLDGHSREFSLPQEIVPVRRSARVIVEQPTVREIPIQSAPDAPEVDVSRYLHALRRNWLLGAMLGILMAGPLAALVWWLNPVEYTAVEFVRISPNHVPLVFETADSTGRFDAKGFKNTQRQLLMQPLALNKAIKDADVANSPLVRDELDPIGWLQKNLKVTFPDEAEIMNISLTLKDPLVAYKIVKEVVKVYMSDVVEKERAERKRRVDQLEEILVKAEDNIRKKRNQLIERVEKLGTSDSTTLNLAQQSTLQQYALLRGELSKIGFELMRAKSELQAKNDPQSASGDSSNSKVKPDGNGTVAKPETSGNPLFGSTAPQNDVKVASGDPVANGSPSTETDDVRLLEALETDPVATRLARDVEQLQNRIQQTEKRYDPKTAAAYVVKYRAQLEEAKQKLADRTKRVQRLLLEAQESKGGIRIENLPKRIGVLEMQDVQLREEMKILEAESKKFGRSSIDVEMMRKEIDQRLDPIVSRVSQEIERTKIEMQSASRITPYPSIGVPSVGENKKRIPLTAAAGVFGLFLPLAFFVWRDSSKNHVNNIRTINDGVRISVLGSIPRVPSSMMKRLNDPKHVGARHWRERISESVTAVTALLLRKLANEGHRVIMVCSAISGEGKSTLSEQLARSLADSGHRTLLIDFDLRRPELHRRFNVPLGLGASDILRHGADLKQTVLQTYSPNLNLLTAGSCAGSLLLDSANGSLEALLKECRADYELVIVDSSPLLPVVDGRLVGQYTDGAIMTVVKDTSKVPQIMAARNIMGDYGIAVLGCVVTGEDNDAYYNSYGQSHEKGAVARGITASRSTSAM